MPKEQVQDASCHSFNGAQPNTSHSAQDPEKTLITAPYRFHSLVTPSVHYYSHINSHLPKSQINVLFTQVLPISNQKFKLLFYQMEHLREYSFYGMSLQQLAYIFKAMAT